MKLQLYPAYKPSGLQWLGDVPPHWEVRPGRAAFREVIQREHPDEQLLSVTIARGVIAQETLLQDSSQKDSSRLDKSDYKLVCPGDIVYNKMRAWQGAVGVSAFRGIVSPAYVVQRLRSRSEPSYFHHLMRLPAFATEAERWSYGIASDMWSLRPEHFKMIQFPLPPLPEQRAIVRYLDYVDRRIRRYVAAKRKLIALLEEEKQAIVNQAVTRGLDPNVRLKPSGVEWLGNVPEHWEVRRAKFLYREADERSTTGTEELMSVSHITGVTPRKKSVTMFMAESNMGYKLCRPGDIVINTMWAFMAALGVARQTGLVSPSYGVYRPLNIGRLSHDYIDSLLTTEVYRTNYLIRSTGITSSRLRLYPESFLDIPLLCPPSADQAAIVWHLERAMTTANVAIARARRQIVLLQEYRTRLVADVVTGKLDVREAAAQLPDEADGGDPTDEGESVGQGRAEPAPSPAASTPTAF